MLSARFSKTITLIIAFALLSASGCGSGSESADNTNDQGVNLIALSHHARQNIETGVLDLNAPRLSYYFIGGGWSAPYPEPEFGDQTILAVNDFARLRFNVIKPADRWLAFTVKSRGHWGGPAKQAVSVFIGEEEIDRIECGGESPLRRAVKIPAERQTPGTNVILLRFSDLDVSKKFRSSRNERRGFPYRGVAAYFTDMRVLYSEPGTGNDEITWKEEQVFATANEDRVLRQRATSDLTYGFAALPGTVLHVSGTFEPAAGEDGDVTVAIMMRSDNQPEWRDLWRESYANGNQRESFSGDFPLELSPATHFELRFRCESSRGGPSDASVIWTRAALELPKETPSAASEPVREAVRLNGSVRNVVIIVLDAFRADHLGQIKDGEYTPNLTALAGESLVFSNAVSAAPYTVASISSLFSGLIPDAHGVRRGRDTFPDHLDTMAKAFSRKNYYTLVMAGLPFIKRKFGITRACEKEVYLRPDADRANGISRMDLDLMRSSIAEAKASGKPVFIYTHLLPPHWPYSPPEPFGDTKNHDGKEKDRAQRKLREDLARGLVKAEDQRMQDFFAEYKRNLAYGDFVAKTMIDYLKQHDLYDDTLLIIAADHGEAFGEHRALGHSSTTYDDMIHVPIVFHYPGVQKGVSRVRVGLVDLFPTIAEVMDLEVLNEQIDGRSFAPLLTGASYTPSEYYYSRAVDYTVSLKVDKTHYTYDRTRFSLRGERYKYQFNDWADELYDLENDPLETKNIADRLPAMTSALRQRGLALIARAQARRAAGPDAVIGAEEEEELRNLGYLQ